MQYLDRNGSAVSAIGIGCMRIVVTRLHADCRDKASCGSFGQPAPSPAGSAMEPGQSTWGLRAPSGMRCIRRPAIRCRESEGLSP